MPLDLEGWVLDFIPRTQITIIFECIGELQSALFKDIY